MEIPVSARTAMQKLRAAGYEARLVGGCVRDMLRGCEPNDWDICTSARPEQMLEVFAADRVIPTGLQHGTLTVLMDGQPLEITCYRAESGYSDSRHPDRVDFVSDIRQDLSRRDFTVNAMAWDGETGLIDLFGGAEDLRRGVIRCVGEPSERFSEDALRILRALRFAARFDFAVEEKTAASIHALKARLHAVSAERIFAELRGLVMGQAAARVLTEFSDVLAELWRGAKPFAPDAPEDLAVRLALLLRDAGADALDSLRCETALKRQVRELWEAPAPTDALSLRRLALRYGTARARQAALMHGRTAEETDEALRESPILSLRDLTVGGDELQALGYAGADIGAALSALADAVLRGALKNDKQTLLAEAKKSAGLG